MEVSGRASASTPCPDSCSPSSFCSSDFLCRALLWIVVGALIDGTGEVGTFWLAIVIGPLLTVAFLATVDFMHDYARIRLVTRGEGVFKAFIGGSGWALSRMSAIILYKSWFFVAAILWLVPFWLDLSLAKTTVMGMLGAFLLQQVVILLRQAVSVAWIGSEVEFFEGRFVEPVGSTNEDETGDDSSGEEGTDQTAQPDDPEAMPDDAADDGPTSGASPNGPR